MAHFDSKIFNPNVFGKYVDRIPNLKRNELLKSGFILFYSDDLELDVITNNTAYGSIYGGEFDHLGEEVIVTYFDEDGIGYIKDEYDSFLSYECFAVDWED